MFVAIVVTHGISIFYLVLALEEFDVNTVLGWRRRQFALCSESNNEQASAAFFNTALSLKRLSKKNRLERTTYSTNVGGFRIRAT